MQGAILLEEGWRMMLRDGCLRGQAVKSGGHMRGGRYCASLAPQRFATQTRTCSTHQRAYTMHSVRRRATGSWSRTIRGGHLKQSPVYVKRFTAKVTSANRRKTGQRSGPMDTPQRDCRGRNRRMRQRLLQNEQVHNRRFPNVLRSRRLRGLPEMSRQISRRGCIIDTCPGNYLLLLR